MNGYELRTVGLLRGLYTPEEIAEAEKPPKSRRKAAEKPPKSRRKAAEKPLTKGGRP